jgi:hypothetical protein
MTNIDELFGWLAIGGGAALAVMIWPFRRGVTGVVVNLLVGPGSAVVAPLIVSLARPQTTPRTLLFFAAAGALLGLAVAHVGWVLGTRNGGGSGPGTPAAAGSR